LRVCGGAPHPRCEPTLRSSAQRLEMEVRPRPNQFANRCAARGRAPSWRGNAASCLDEPARARGWTERLTLFPQQYRTHRGTVHGFWSRQADAVENLDAEMIRDKGRLGWRKAVGYGRRSLRKPPYPATRQSSVVAFAPEHCRPRRPKPGSAARCSTG
jgi:hypothetical protein